MLSKRCQYALHALQSIANSPEHRGTTIKKIARECGLPAKFLGNILLILRKGGIINSKSGRSGGYRLAMPPGQITLLSILTLMDGPLTSLPCTPDGTPACRSCRDPQGCHIRMTFLKYEKIIEAELSARTLKSLLSIDSQPE